MATKTKEVEEVRDIYREIYGYRGDEMDYTPELFETLDIPKKDRYSVQIEPMSVVDCALLDQIEIQSSIDLWDKVAEFEERNNVKIQDIEDKITKKNNAKTEKTKEAVKITNKEFVLYGAYRKMFRALSHSPEKAELVFPYIKGFKNHAEIDNGKTLQEVWKNTPLNFKNDITSKIISISILSESERINL